jgi:hypothetical protein
MLGSKDAAQPLLGASHYMRHSVSKKRKNDIPFLVPGILRQLTGTASYLRYGGILIKIKLFPLSK